MSRDLLPSKLQHLALERVGSTNATIELRYLQQNSRPSVFTHGSNPDAIRLQLTVGDDAKSIAQLVGEAGYNVNDFVPGLPTSAVHGIIKVISGVVAYANVGTDAGFVSGEDGLDSSFPDVDEAMEEVLFPEDELRFGMPHPYYGIGRRGGAVLLAGTYQPTWSEPSESSGDRKIADFGRGGMRVSTAFPAGDPVDLVADEIDSLPDANGQLTNWWNFAGQTAFRLRYKFMTGTSPTVDTLVEFFLATADAEGTPFVDAGLTYSASASAQITDATLRDLLIPLGAVKVAATSNKSYTGSLPVEALGAHRGAILVWNGTGAALHATAGNFDLDLYAAA